MRHRVKGKKLNRHAASRKALIRELSKGVLEHGKIKTTVVKAKYVKPHVEKLITIAGKNDLSSHRRLISELQDKKLAKKVLTEIGPTYKEVNGGYTRIRKLGLRQGDSAEMAELSLVEIKIDRPSEEGKVKSKGKKDARTKSKNDNKKEENVTDDKAKKEEKKNEDIKNAKNSKKDNSDKK